MNVWLDSALPQTVCASVDLIDEVLEAKILLPKLGTPGYTLDVHEIMDAVFTHVHNICRAQLSEYLSDGNRLH